MSLSRMPIVLDGMKEVADRYDGYIFDLWGVVHNGVEALPGAIDVMQKLRANGSRVAFLSNAPRRNIAVANQLSDFSILPDQYDVIMSSGEEDWRHLFERTDPWYSDLGHKCLHIGAERDRGMFEDLDLVITEDPTDAEFVLNTGTFADGDSIDSYESLLRDIIARRLPMICANPDLVVMRGDKEQICAGTLAERFEILGGTVRWHGKPDPSVYIACLARLEMENSNRTLMIGDSFRTDICGANHAGIDSLFVAGGIHATDLFKTDGSPDLLKVEEASRVAAARPDYVIGTVTW